MDILIYGDHDDENKLEDMMRVFLEFKGAWFVTGTLGLWNGKKKVWACFDELGKAIRTCTNNMDYIEIRETGRGRTTIRAYHHDGVNIFELRRLDRERKTLSDCRKHSTNGRLLKILGGE